MNMDQKNMNEQNVPQSNEPIQGSKNIWTIIVAVIITALVVGGSIYVWQRLNSKNMEQDLQQQIGTNQVANNNDSSNTNTAADPTAGWKTYTNAMYGYTIQYPKDLSVVEPCGTTGTLVTFCVVFRNEVNNITVFVHPSTDIVSNGWLSAVTITSDKQETINNISWRRIVTKGGPGPNQSDRLGQSAITVKGDRSFSLNMTYYAEFDEMIENYENMLSTFTFAN